ncbi:MAG: HtaA domain-containing protein [Natronosporangium sp.]
MSVNSVSRRRPLRLGLAAVAAGVLTFGVATPAIAQQQGHPIVDGSADWGIKESFRSYVTGPIAGGQITVSDGATENGDGTFRFGSGTGEYDPETHDLTAAFDGTVQFQGHAAGDEWELDLTISAIAVSVDAAAESGELTADVVSRSLDTGEFTEYGGITLAELDLTGISPEPGDDGSTTLAGIPSVLAEEGAAAFAGFYQAGEELDPVTVTVQVDAAPPGNNGDGDGDGDGDGNQGGNGGAGQDDGDPAASLPLTGGWLPGLLAVGTGTLLAGTAVLWLTRRRAQVDG